MYGKAALKAFQNDSLETASPNKLLLMLFDRLCLDIKRAIAAQQSGDHTTAHSNLVHAQNIISALQEGLDKNWSNAAEFSGIYQFLYEQLVAANTKRDQNITQGCLEVAEELNATWHEVAAKAATETPVPLQQSV